MNSIAAVIVAVGAMAQNEPKVLLTTDAPIYKIGAGSVKIAVQNIGTSAMSLSNPGPWAVYNVAGTKLVYTPITIQIPITLDPGQQTSWTWDQKSLSGKPVPSGTYRVTLRVGTSKFSCWIALTPTGKIAGSSYFPLRVGNQWSYSGTSQNSYLAVGQQQPNSQWFQLKGVFGNSWVRLEMGQKQTLFVKKGASIQPLFRFGLLWKFWYPIKFGGMSGLMAGALNETVVTPAGIFLGCYRLDATESDGAPLGFSSFWFARGVGLVQYSKLAPGGNKVFRLREATLKGTDGKTYTLGRK